MTPYINCHDAVAFLEGYVGADESQAAREAVAYLKTHLTSETRCGLPRQPTDEMCMAGVLEANKGTQAEGYANGIGRMSAIWAAMYDAYKPSCNGRHVWPDQPERTMASLCEKCGMTFARHVAVECP